MNEANQAHENTVSGGPEAGNVPIGGQEVVETPPPVSTPQEGAPLYLGGRKFANVEEMAAYMSDQEAQLRAFQIVQASAKPNQVTERSPHEILFENPEEALTLLEKKIFSKIDGRSAEKELQTRTWSEFYTQNPDLKGHEDLVDHHFAKLLPSLRDKPSSVGLPIVATETRKMIAKIRGDAGGVKLESRSATVAGASGAPVSRIEVQQEPKNFAEQMRAMQSKGRTKG